MLNLILLPLVLGLVQYRVVAQQLAACTLTGYDWMYNSLQQDPCSIAMKIGGVCNGGTFTFYPLLSGQYYSGPDPPTPCACNTVFYSLLAACSICQGNQYTKFSIMATNCTAIYSQQYPAIIPGDTAVPHYAYLDVETYDTFDVVAAKAAGGPESTSPPRSTYYPTSTTSTTSSTIATTGPAQSSSTVPATTAKKKNVGAIAGGVIGAVAFFAILGILVFICLRRKPAPPLPMPQQITMDVGYSQNPYTNNSMATNSMNSGRPPQYFGTPEV